MTCILCPINKGQFINIPVSYVKQTSLFYESAPPVQTLTHSWQKHAPSSPKFDTWTLICWCLFWLMLMCSIGLSWQMSRSCLNTIIHLHLLCSFCSHVQVPPLEVERFSADVGATVHLTQQFVVGGEVVYERAAKTQALHQGAHLCLQGTVSVHLGAKGLRDAEIFPEHDHVDLTTHDGMWDCNAVMSAQFDQQMRAS